MLKDKPMNIKIAKIYKIVETTPLRKLRKKSFSLLTWPHDKISTYWPLFPYTQSVS